MSASTGQELQMLGTVARQFAQGELVAGREDSDEYPFKPLFAEALAKAGGAGFFELMLPEEMGGADRSVKALCTVLREVCLVDASLGGVIFTNALAQEVLMSAGAQELLGGPGDGGPRERLLAFTAFDDPVQTGNTATAVVEDGAYLLHGTVEYVVLGGLAGRALVAATVEGEDGASLFLIETGLDEVAVGEPVVSLGLHACPAVDVEFRGAPAALVGSAGRAAQYLGEAADRMGVACAAMAAGVMRGSFDTALEYTRGRFQGGREIIDWSQVRMALADMAVSIECADLVVEAASATVDGGGDGWTQASRAAALQVCQVACDVTSDGIQLLGGNGYMHEYGQEKRFRDAQHLQMFLGMPPLRRLSYAERILEGGAL